MWEKIIAVEQEIAKLSIYSKEKSDQLGEVFTPPELINEILDNLENSVWQDPNRTYFDPAAGHGNFHIQILKRLFLSLDKKIPNESVRLKHIVENQLYFAEYQKSSCDNIKRLFSFEDDFRVNIYEGDATVMPENYFS